MRTVVYTPQGGTFTIFGACFTPLRVVPYIYLPGGSTQAPAAAVHHRFLGTCTVSGPKQPVCSPILVSKDHDAHNRASDRRTHSADDPRQGSVAVAGRSPRPRRALAGGSADAAVVLSLPGGASSTDFPAPSSPGRPCAERTQGGRLDRFITDFYPKHMIGKVKAGCPVLNLGHGRVQSIEVAWVSQVVAQCNHPGRSGRPPFATPSPPLRRGFLEGFPEGFGQGFPRQ